MEKKTAHFLCCGVAVLMVGGLLLTNLQLSRQVKELRGQLSSAEDRISLEVRRVQSLVDGEYSRIQTLLSDSASLFSKAETALAYENGQLVYTASVIPKEVRTGETLALSVDGVAEPVEMTWEQDYYSAHVALPLKEEINATVVFRAQEGTRMEVLPTLNSRDMLSLDYNTDWVPSGGDHMAEYGELLYVELYPDIITPAQLGDAQMVCVIVDGVIGTEVGRVDLSPTEGTHGYQYQANLAEYLGLKGEYSIRLEVILPGGLRLTESGSAAAGFRSSETGTSGRSAGGGSLYPEFQEDD